MNTFEDLELISPVQRALADENYERPTAIQAKTIPAALDGRDILGCAQTGTGKTAAFALPILNRLGQSNRKAIPNHPFVLLLAPTRELAIQIGESFATYGKHLRLRQTLVYGGVSQSNQVRALRRGAHILVATPGRLLDLMNQGHIQLDRLEVFVLDEADRMLDMGFLPDLKRIISKLPNRRQSLFFSATLPSKITDLSQQLLNNPISVNVTPKSVSVEQIDQRMLFMERSEKKAILRKVLAAADVDRALVFTRTKRGADAIAKMLTQNGIQCASIHGNKSQSARQKALSAFRRRHVQVLGATDVAARGIDIDGITHVVNFDLPDEPENYVHRIGRTGRAGSNGTALSFCTDTDHCELRAIEQLIGMKVPIDAQHPQPARARSGNAKQRSSRPPRGRRTASIQRQHRKGSGSRRTANQDGSTHFQPGSASGNSQRNPRRTRRKQRVKQVQ